MNKFYLVLLVALVVLALTAELAEAGAKEQFLCKRKCGQRNADSKFPDRTVLENSNYCQNPYQFGTFNSSVFPTHREQPFRLLQCDNPGWSFSAFWQTVVTEQTNRFWKIHIDYAEPTPTVQPCSAAKTGTDGISSTGTGTVVSSADIVSSTSMESSSGETDQTSVTSAFSDLSPPVQSSAETVATSSTSASSQSTSSSDNTIQPSFSPGDQSSSVQFGTSAGTATVQPSSTAGTQTAQPSSSETTPPSTTGGTAQSTAGTLDSSVTFAQSSATSSVQTIGTGSVDSSTSGAGSHHSSGAQSTDSVRTTGTAQSTETGFGINPSATQASSTGTGVTATTAGTGMGTPPSSYTTGVNTAQPKMEIKDEEWKLAVVLGVAMCILFILGILLTCFIIHVNCCKDTPSVVGSCTTPPSCSRRKTPRRATASCQPLP